jgi:hypothetical protein
MYKLDTFVNTNAATHFFPIPKASNVDLDALEPRFSKQVMHDKVVDDACPVIVYELNSKPVAWYDIELLRGFIVP